MPKASPRGYCIGIVPAFYCYLTKMLPAWSGELANLYYRARSCRDRACKQRYWRRIAVEKKRLLASGVPYIELHLVTRVLARPGERSSEDRLRSYKSQLPLF